MTHSVRIQSLETKKDKYTRECTSEDVKAAWKRVKCEHGYRSKEPCQCKLLAYEENIPCNIGTYTNGFYSAFANAYNNHEDVTISPDDVWMTIMIQFSKFVNDNAEALRTLFVSHEGKKKLVVTTGQETEESQWTEFCLLMREAVKKNTKGDIVSVLEPGFTTSGRVENLLASIGVMDSFKKYFSYGRCIPCCGINNVHFLGTLDDWKKLVDKLIDLKQYGVVGDWNSYVDNLVPVLKKFVETYEGKVDVDYWNKIMNIKHGRLGSGSTTYISGWILNFFGLAGQTVEDIPNKSFSVEVQIDNKLTGEMKNVFLVGGFSNALNFTDGSYRPQMSYAVYYDGVNKGEETSN
eukprot:TRINITY_DN852_c0_g1_i1.p1 TRINITY_DN852_c0_g1~~TRINITY_DN852_c0_g1_i1.p1  ORF type:complete len:350 (-),score=62.08 TRINITY_DN852_c0_g1_i1:49-1098(-)